MPASPGRHIGLGISHANANAVFSRRLDQPHADKAEKKEPHRGSDPKQGKIPFIHLRALIL